MSPDGAPRYVFLSWRDCGHAEGGGSEKFVERVAEYLVSTGAEVTLCCAAYSGAPADEIRNGVHIRRRGGRLTVYLRGLAYLLGRSGRRADVVVDVQNGIPFFSALARRRGVVVLVHHVHREQWQIIYPGRAGRIGWWIESRLSPRLYRGRPYITVSDATAADLAALGVDAASIDIVRNGIDAPHPQDQALRSDTPTVCVLGRLVPHKQVEHALVVASTLSASVPDLRVEIVGDGWWRDHVAGMTRELGLTDRVVLHGHLSDAERDEVLDRSWLLLVPSVKEGWGINIMEAAARGVPAIAYASAGGVAEAIVDGETGRLVDDVDAMAKRTEELLCDPVLRDDMGARARERAAGFSWSRTGRRFADVVAARLGVGADQAGCDSGTGGVVGTTATAGSAPTSVIAVTDDAAGVARGVVRRGRRAARHHAPRCERGEQRPDQGRQYDRHPPAQPDGHGGSSRISLNTDHSPDGAPVCGPWS